MGNRNIREDGANRYIYLDHSLSSSPQQQTDDDEIMTMLDNSDTLKSRSITGLARRLRRRRTVLEKAMFALIVLLLLVVFTLTLTLVNFNSRIDQLNNEVKNVNNNIKYNQKQPTELKPTAREKEYCNTSRCLMVAAEMYSSINHNADPCDDFYEYACGSWEKKNLIPSGYERWHAFNLLSYQNEKLIKNQLESFNASSRITEAEKKAVTFYQSCMDANGTIDKLGLRPLTNIIDKLVRNSEAAAQANKSSNSNSTANKTLFLVYEKTLEELITLAQLDYARSALFDFNIHDDQTNPNFTNIEISQGSLGLDRSIYVDKSSKENEKLIKIYKKSIVKAIKLLFGDIRNADEEMEAMVEFETSLAKIMLSKEQLSDVKSIYTRVKIGALRKKHAPFFDWKSFFNRGLDAYGSTTQSTLIDDEDEIVVYGLDYFDNLQRLVVDFQTSGRERTIKLFVVFRLIRFFAKFLPESYRIVLGALDQDSGAMAAERWQVCVQQMDNNMGLGYAIARTYLRAASTISNVRTTKALSEQMIGSIKRAFIEHLARVMWMDDETRRLAEEKVNHVHDKIAYPDFVENNDKLLDARLDGLHLIGDDYFGNAIRMIQFMIRTQMQKFRTRVDPTSWEMNPSAVNAYYSPTRNQIVFPSGILQVPFFHPDNPMSVNYGAIGSVMGHELTHGFDNHGREYDKTGTMKQWWNNRTIERFENATQCMVEQYSRYKIANSSINGKLTLGENLADGGGLRMSFKAYKKWTRTNGQEKPLPLLDMSHEQLFFVSFAQLWCAKFREDSLRLSLATDVHSPHRIRVIGSFSNLNEFANAFSCPLNSPMNPAKKCKIW